MIRFFTLCLAMSLATLEAFKPSAPARTTFRSSLNMGSVIDELKSEGNFNTLLAAIDAAGLTEMYNKESLTLLAPNDKAFEMLGAGAVDNLLKDQDKLKETLLFHTHLGKLDPSRNGRTFDTAITMDDGFAKQLTVKVTSWTNFRYIIDGADRGGRMAAQILDRRADDYVHKDGSVDKGVAGEFYSGRKCDNGLMHEISEVLQVYEGSEAPTVTCLGARDLEGAATLQKSFEGELADFGFGYKGDDPTINKDFNKGQAWKSQGYLKTDSGRGGYVKNEKGGDLAAFYSKQNSGRPDELETTGKKRKMQSEAEILTDRKSVV